MNDLHRTLLVFLGAGVGGTARYWLDRLIHTPLPRSFPWGTLTINVTGCLAIGVLAAVLAPATDRNEPLRLALMVGLLGGYTTFSAFGRETFAMLTEQRFIAAALYVLASVALGLLAVWAGSRVGTLVR